MDFPVRRVATLLSLAALTSLALPAHAVEPLDTFSVRVGGYTSSFDTEVRADGQTDQGTEVDLERDLDMDPDNLVGFVGFTWRPFQNHEFAFNYYGNDTSKTHVIDRDIEFNGEVYEANATIDSDFDIDAYEVSYVWWAANHENWALGPRFGLVWYSVDLKLSMVRDGMGNASSVRGEVNTDIPAPTIGGAWRWVPAEDWRIGAEAGYLSAKVSDVDASIAFGRAGVEWFPWENWGFSADYVVNRIKAEADETDFDGDLHFVDRGFRLGAVYRF